MEGSAFCKAFKEYGKNNDILVEDIDHEENDDNAEGHGESNEAQDTIQLPYMQNNDGELFYSNSLDFEKNQCETNSNSDENEVDNECDEFELFRDLVQSTQLEQSISQPKIELPPQ